MAHIKIAVLFLAAFLAGCSFISPPSEEEVHKFVLMETYGRRIFWSDLSRNFINNMTTGYVYVACGPNKKLWVYVRASVWGFQIEPREKCPDKIYEENI